MADPKNSDRPRWRGLILAAGWIVAAAATPVSALDDILPRPENCQPILTVQHRGCSVQTIYDCAEGQNRFRRHESFDAIGLVSVEHRQRNADLIQHSDARASFHLLGGAVITPMPAPKAIAQSGTGSASAQFDLVIFGQSRTGLSQMTLRPEDLQFRLGDTVLQKFKGDVALILPRPMPTISGWTMLYHDARSGAIFEGESHIDFLAEPDTDIPETPAAVIRPGAPGFATTIPEYDCEQISVLANPAGGYVT